MSAHLTDSPTTENHPFPDGFKTDQVTKDFHHTSALIESVQPQQLRSAILEVCIQLPEASRLLNQLLGEHEVAKSDENCLIPTKTQESERKRKRDDSESVDGEICDDCGEKATDEDGGCCKWRRMRTYQREEDEEELKQLEEDGDVCPDCGGDIEDWCCHTGSELSARKHTLASNLS